MMTVNAEIGEDIRSACAALAAAARKEGMARMAFNEIEIVASATDTPDDLVKKWEQESNARYVEWLNSPEYAKEKRERDEFIARLQETHDDLVADLKTLDWSSDVAVLSWICAIQPATDDIDVKTDKATILSAFERHGFKPNECTGADYKDGDRNLMFRYIVGQALATLKMASIHGLVQSFADQWKAKFIN